MPNELVQKQIDPFILVPLNKNIISKSATGPMKDLEDNIQLHSAATYDCDIFLTSDRELLKLAYFGKMKIVDKLL